MSFDTVQIGDCTLIHGDCLEVLPTLEPVSLVLTDPPYGTQDLGNGYGRRQNHDPNGKSGRTIHGDKDLTVFSGMIDAIKVESHGALITFCAPRRMNEVDEIVKQSGLKFFGELIWDKGTPGLGYTIRYSHESALVYAKGEIETPKQALLSVVRYQVNHIKTEEKHPHEKPLVFWLNAIRLIDHGSVCDPFMGHGNVGVTCIRTGRRFIGIEIDKDYFDIACKRIEAESKQIRMFT